MYCTGHDHTENGAKKINEIKCKIIQKKTIKKNIQARDLKRYDSLPHTTAV